MMSNRLNMQCQYHYDPLDQLVGVTSNADTRLLRFYCKNNLTTEIQGAVLRSIFQYADQLLAQQYRQSNTVELSLLATDQMRSVIRLFKSSLKTIAYLPYGYHPSGESSSSLLAFNGERPDPLTKGYLLGNGYRAFSSVLMRFNSPDVSSPFGAGGINYYAYCSGDPINFSDPSGHFSFSKAFNAFFRGSKRKDTYTHVGYHGTPKPENVKSLVERGPDRALLGTGNGENQMGEGFYAAPDYPTAKIYALEYFNVPNSGEVLKSELRNGAAFSKQVLNVEVRNIHRYKFGRDYGVSEREMVFRPHMFKDIRLVRGAVEDGRGYINSNAWVRRKRF